MNTDKTYAEKVAAEYAPKETSKVVALKKLDRKAMEKCTKALGHNRINVVADNYLKGL